MTPARLFRVVASLCGTALLVALTGCGSSAKSDVSGTVKLRGQAPKFTGIEIIFHHPDGTRVSAYVQEDGTYRAEGVPSGDVNVCFAYTSPDARQQGAEVKAGAGSRLKKPGDKGEAVKIKPAGNPGPTTNPIPQNLRDTSTSEIKLTVEGGKTNTFDYDIPAVLNP